MEHHLGGLSAAHRDVLDQAEERLGALREVGRLRRPVVHLGVDVDGVLAVPGRRELVIPLSLKIRGHRAGATARNQQVTAKMKVQSFERKIFGSALHLLQSLISRQIMRSFAEVQLHALKQSLVIGDVPAPKQRIRLSGAEKIS